MSRDTLGPAGITSDPDRIVTLDILRGMALFGMILVHFHQTMEIPSTGAEDLVGWTIWMGVETKSWATFAFLFGAGFAILMRRAETRGLKVVPLYLRRMLGLAVIGLAVQLLLGFRILLDYAIWASCCCSCATGPHEHFCSSRLLRLFRCRSIHEWYRRTAPRAPQ